MKGGFIIRPIIKYGESVICKNCAYFREVRGQALLGKCTKFGEKNIITGKISYACAYNVRNDEDLCGKRGVYYIEK
jgi:hypothetical protein